MKLMGIFKREKRSSELPDWMTQTGFSDGSTTPVTIESSLGVPAVWAAVQFLSGTIAGLPLQVFQKTPDGSDKITDGIALVLGKAVSDEMSSFAWRKYGFEQVLTGGRFVSYIERNGARQVVNIFPINPASLKIKSDGMKTTYEVKVKGGVTRTYSASDVIDIPFMLNSDMVKHRSPILTNKRAISVAIESARYGAKAFSNGGVPPLVATGPFVSAAGAQRASDDIAKTIKQANSDGRQVITMPTGHELKPLGFNAKDMQMTEAQRFCIEEIARIYSLPPVFLQDLTHGTFSNTEQQDLQLVKHTVRRWVEQFEQEMNLKLFGRLSDMYVKFNVDALLRGDFASRMAGIASAIQNAQLTPNEGRGLDERKPLNGGDELMIQGATVPISGQKPIPNNGEN